MNNWPYERNWHNEIWECEPKSHRYKIVVNNNSDPDNIWKMAQDIHKTEEPKCKSNVGIIERD